MHRIDGAGHVNGTFVTEDLAVSRPPTEITADWLNAVQGEIASMIEAAELVLDKLDNGQLLQAINYFVGQRLALAGGTMTGPLRIAGTNGGLYVGTAGGLKVNVNELNAGALGVPGNLVLGHRDTTKTLVLGNEVVEIGSVNHDGNRAKVMIGESGVAPLHTCSIKAHPGNSYILNVMAASGAAVMQVQPALENGVNATWGSPSAVLFLAKDSVTGRSANLAGTLNQSGADVAEYRRLARQVAIAKGDVVGFNAAGEITTVWSEALTYGVKTTNPWACGNDGWSTSDALGLTPPVPPVKPGNPFSPPRRDDLDDAAFAAINGLYTVYLANHDQRVFAYQALQDQYELAKAQYQAALDEARSWVDRIAISGVCPINNANDAPIGSFILAAESPVGGITTRVVTTSDIVADRGLAADVLLYGVGRVRARLTDGRSEINVL